MYQISSIKLKWYQGIKIKLSWLKCALKREIRLFLILFYWLYLIVYTITTIIEVFYKQINA